MDADLADQGEWAAMNLGEGGNRAPAEGVIEQSRQEIWDWKDAEIIEPNPDDHPAAGEPHVSFGLNPHEHLLLRMQRPLTEAFERVPKTYVEFEVELTCALWYELPDERAYLWLLDRPPLQPPSQMRPQYEQPEPEQTLAVLTMRFYLPSQTGQVYVESPEEHGLETWTNLRFTADTTADHVRLLMNLVLWLRRQTLRLGRPKGTGDYANREEFHQALRRALAAIKGRPSIQQLADFMNHTPRTIQKYIRMYGWPEDP